MATKITAEHIVEINELYIKLKNKSQVARTMGISPSTVSKYIKADYKPAAEVILTKYEGEITGADWIVEELKGKKLLDTIALFRTFKQLSENEKEKLKEFQNKEIMV